MGKVFLPSQQQGNSISFFTGAWEQCFFLHSCMGTKFLLSQLHGNSISYSQLHGNSISYSQLHGNCTSFHIFMKAFVKGNFYFS